MYKIVFTHFDIHMPSFWKKKRKASNQFAYATLSRIRLGELILK